MAPSQPRASLRRRALASSASPMALMRDRDWGLAMFDRRPIVTIRESLAERLDDPAAGETGVTESHDG